MLAILWEHLGARHSVYILQGDLFSQSSPPGYHPVGEGPAQLHTRQVLKD